MTYNRNAIYTQVLQGSVGFVKVASKNLTWVPGTQYDPGSPGVPGTPATFKLKKNKGWNTSARSIAILARGTYFDFNCNTGVSGCCVGIYKNKQTKITLQNFTHAIVCDIHGIHIFEDNELITTLKSTQAFASNIRVYLGLDNRVQYVVTTASESLIYTSLTPLTLIIPYIYGYLYQAGDKILTASYNSGEVKYGSV